jgi:HEAT repeat protein
MSVLYAIWAASLGLTALALLGMITLILVRVIRGWRHAREAELQADMTRALLLAAEGKPTPMLDKQLSRREQSALLDAGIALLDLVRGSTALRIVETLARGGATATLERWLGSANPERRAAAAEMLVYFASPGEREILRMALDDPEHDVRLAAAVSLIRLGAAPPLPDLMALLGGERKPSARLGQVLEAIFAVRPAEVLALAQSERLGSFARAKAIETLAASGLFSMLPALQDLVGSADPDIRTAAIRGLGRLAHPSSGAIITKAFQDEAWFVRAAAAEAIGKIGLYEFAPALTDLAQDKVWWVRFRAGEALAALDAAGRGALRRVVARVGASTAQVQPSQAASARAIA